MLIACVLPGVLLVFAKFFVFVIAFIILDLPTFDLPIKQNSETLFYLKELGVKNIKKISNLKYYGEKLQSKVNQLLKKKFLNRDIWCAASTHEGEEIIIAKIHKRIKFKNKKLLTILIHFYYFYVKNYDSFEKLFNLMAIS